MISTKGTSHKDNLEQEQPVNSDKPRNVIFLEEDVEEEGSLLDKLNFAKVRKRTASVQGVYAKL